MENGEICRSDAINSLNKSLGPSTFEKKNRQPRLMALTLNNVYKLAIDILYICDGIRFVTSGWRHLVICFRCNLK